MFNSKTALAAAVMAFALSAGAAPISTAFVSTASAVQTFHGDSLSDIGATGTLLLDTAGTTTNTVNTALAVFRFSNGVLDDNTTVPLSFDLTFGGVTHTLTQNANIHITINFDTILAFDASAPVLFSTAAGNWLVELNGYTVGSGSEADVRLNVTADFTAVPEPGSLALAGISLFGLAAARRRRG